MQLCFSTIVIMEAPPLIVCGGRCEIFQKGYTCKVKVTEVRLSASYITLSFSVHWMENIGR